MILVAYSYQYDISDHNGQILDTGNSRAEAGILKKMDNDVVIFKNGHRYHAKQCYEIPNERLFELQRNFVIHTTRTLYNEQKVQSNPFINMRILQEHIDLMKGGDLFIEKFVDFLNQNTYLIRNL